MYYLFTSITAFYIYFLAVHQSSHNSAVAYIVQSMLCPVRVSVEQVGVPKCVYLACHWGQVQGWVVITSMGSAQDKQGLFPISPGASASWYSL